MGNESKTLMDKPSFKGLRKKGGREFGFVRWYYFGMPWSLFSAKNQDWGHQYRLTPRNYSSKFITI